LVFRKRVVYSSYTSGEHIELVAQLHQTVLFFGTTVDDDMIPGGTAGGADQQRIGVLRLFQDLRVKEGTVFFPGGAV